MGTEAGHLPLINDEVEVEGGPPLMATADDAEALPTQHTGAHHGS
jgi:hypothetical protein